MPKKPVLMAAALLAMSIPAWPDDSTTPAPASKAGQPFDAAAAFGGREDVMNLRISPDGKRVAFVSAGEGQGSSLITLELAKGSQPQVAFVAAGKPDRLGACNWVSNERLVCIIYGVVNDKNGVFPFTRVMAVDRGGANPQLLSKRQNEHSRGIQLGGGQVLDWLPDEDGAVLMSRVYLPDDHLGTRIGSSQVGLGVDWLDTRNLTVKQVETPSRDAVNYISDGRGAIRVIGLAEHVGAGFASGVTRFSYRRRDSRDWEKLADYDSVDGAGFEPLAVDHDLDIVYGLKKLDGRRALYSISLDGSLAEKRVFSRPDVDVSGLVRIGRRNRVVGVTFATDTDQAAYFDPAIDKMMTSLAHALPDHQISVVDSSIDEQVLLVYAGRDDDPGVYYVFDRSTKQLQTFLVVRSALEGVKLGKVKAVSYPAKDGAMIPGYLTFPPGVDDLKGLAAIVLPHGGPSTRDHWGFDWLSQFYAARGYAVLRPNYRGSAGYGDAWQQTNAFKSWRTAIGDIDDAGRWLTAQGADASKLFIVGWSYGGYAALQSAVVDPGLFKAVIAIAPVTDLDALEEQYRRTRGFHIIKEVVGEGSQLRDASPARNAEKIKVPVLLFHGALDRNVSIGESRLMADRLQAAGVKHELVTWDDLDHYLEDSAARMDMLRRSDAFLREAVAPP